MSDRAPPKRAGFPLRLDQVGPSGNAKSSKIGVSNGSASATTRQLLRPQAPLQHAASLAARAAPPSGTGLDSADVRRRMVQRLQGAGLRDESVAAAMMSVPRHVFVDTALAPQAYEDTSLPIGHGQTISKPSVVSRMIALLMEARLTQGHAGLGKVLEIGTGCGYQAAVLATLSSQVVTIERISGLHDKARVTLSSMAELRGRLRLILGDGMLGHAPNAPYDSIIAAAGGDEVPAAWLDQLAHGGRLVAPVQDASQQQSLVVIDRTERGLERSVREGVHFVPLKSGFVR